jgi:predicted amidophosphoribosyltransferase
MPLRRLLRTTRLAAEQHALGRTERARNVLGLFTTRGQVPPTVILVDDLLTSGATLSEAARALRQAGALRVLGLVLARTAGRKG